MKIISLLDISGLKPHIQNESKLHESKTIETTICKAKDAKKKKV
jgi:hypothetical protein